MSLAARIKRLEQSSGKSGRIVAVWCHGETEEERQRDLDEQVAKLRAAGDLSDDDTLIVTSVIFEPPPAIPPKPFVIRTNGRSHEEWLRDLN